MENQIIELEKKYWQGMQDHSYETVRNLTYFPCIIAGKNGVQSIDETSFKKMFESGNADKIRVLGFSDIVSQHFAEDTAAIAYSIELEDGGKHKVMKCACSSTWIKENDHWLCALHTETELSA